MTSKGSASFIAILMRIDRRFSLFSSSNLIFHSAEVTRSQTVVRLILFYLLPSSSKLLSNIDMYTFLSLQYYLLRFSRFSKVSRTYSVCQSFVWECLQGEFGVPGGILLFFSIHHLLNLLELSRQVETKMKTPWPNPFKIVFIPR